MRLQIGLSFFAFVLIGAYDGALGVLNPSMRAHYGIDKATLGYIFFAATLGYLTAAFLSGVLAQKLGRRRFLSVGIGAFLAGAAILAGAPHFLLVIAAMLLVGFGFATIDAGLNAYIALLPDSTRLLNFLHAFYGVGALLGPLIATLVLELRWPWNSTFLVWVVACLALAPAIWWAFTHDYARRHAEHEEQGNVLMATLRLRVVWLAAFFLLLYVGAEVSLGSWGYSFLTEERAEATGFSGVVISGYWLGLTLGRFVIPSLARRIGNHATIQLSLAGTVAGVLLIWLVPAGPVAAVGFWLAGFALGPIFPTTVALMPELVSTRVLPSAIGFMASLGSMGAAFFPWLAGVLAEGWGLWTLLPYVVVLTAIMLLLWLALQAFGGTHKETPSRVEEWAQEETMVG